ncbi:MAG: hypothetical protein RL375_526, partial [Pseudomonadota bacterium]
MFNWLFKKRDRTAAPAPTTPPASAKSAAASSGKRAPPPPAAPTPKPVVVDQTDWPARLRAALGNDAALLQLATATPVLDIKIGAVEALAGEDALKQAEREFRSHDRKVHRIAKKRLETAVAQRVARATALSLIDRTVALIGDDQVAMNQVTELDRAWLALPADLLQPEQRSRYTDLRTQLDIEIRERSDAQQQVQRWTADARPALPDLQRGLATAAEQGVAADIAPLSQALQALLHTCPDQPATAELAAALSLALQDATALEARLIWIETASPERVTPRTPAAPTPAASASTPSEPAPAPVAQPADTTEGAELPAAEQAGAETAPTVMAAAVDAAAVTGAADPAQAPDAPAAPGAGLAMESAVDSAQTATATAAGAFAAPAPAQAQASSAAVTPEPVTLTAAQRWSELPALVDPGLARVLDQRFEQWQRARRAARQPERPAAAGVAATAKVDKPARPARPEPLGGDQLQRVEALVQTGETTLAEGQLSELQQQLAAIDAALGKAGTTGLPDALRGRVQALRAEGARLKGWQQWGGGRARDDLTDEAEALARSTLAASDPEQPDAPKVDIKTQRETIHTLRMRWKELDRLGAPANQGLWQRFDAALQTASVPVAAHHAVLAAARKDNLVARESLLATLEALPLPGSAPAGSDSRAVDNAASDDPHQASGDDGLDPGDTRPVDWKDLVRELGNFQTAWRKLGPVEHTAPADAREALQQRYRCAIERIEAPLQRARRAALAVREQLITQALSLVPSPGSQRLVPDAARQVRELQARWQDHARQLPLARAVENEVWTRFKSATDAVFAQREAVFAARDAEFAANLAAAEAVLDRLCALSADTPRAEIERTIAEADRAWRDGGELPRGALEGIERRFRTARGAATDLLSAGIRARWQAQCDALAARLALCAEREAGASREAG